MNSKNSRICTNCNICKPYTEYSKSKKGKNGIREYCKLCAKEKHKKYYQNNADKLKLKQKEKYANTRQDGSCKILAEKRKKSKSKSDKKYYIKNKEKLNKQSKEKYTLNKEKILLQMKEYRENNKEVIKKRKQKYQKENREKIRERQRLYEKERMPRKSKVIHSLRARIRLALKNYKKSASTEKLIGCTLDFFKKYLESKFTNGMTWDNYGNNGWHIDHIKPCSSFDLSDSNQQKECFHYMNTQPLWATKEIAISYGESSDYIGNLEKSNKIT